MRQTRQRPLGVTIIAGLVAINGVGSLVEAYELARPATGQLAGAALSAAIGLALLHRAYGIWSLKHRAWLVTVALLGLRTVVAAFAVVAAPPAVAAWFGLVVAAITLLYLIQPGVRALFSGSRAGS